jgi:hypothetical protein
LSIDSANLAQAGVSRSAFREGASPGRPARRAAISSSVGSAGAGWADSVVKDDLVDSVVKDDLVVADVADCVAAGAAVWPAVCRVAGAPGAAAVPTSKANANMTMTSDLRFTIILKAMHPFVSFGFFL